MQQCSFLTEIKNYSTQTITTLFCCCCCCFSYPFKKQGIKGTKIFFFSYHKTDIRNTINSLKLKSCECSCDVFYVFCDQPTQIKYEKRKVQLACLFRISNLLLLSNFVFPVFFFSPLFFNG